jgi:hypothetical protein
LRIRDDQHNHSVILRDSHSMHQRIVMTSDVKKQIVIQSRIDTRLQVILNHLRLDVDEDDSLVKTQNVYNQRILIRHEALEFLTITQALLKELFNSKH